MQRASTYIRELFGITSVVAKWRHYLLGAKFFIHTDQQSLKSLLQQVIQTLEQQYYITKLLVYNYEILYKPGKSNAATDAIFRKPEADEVPTISFMAIIKHNLDIVDEIKKEQADDSELQSMAVGENMTIKDGIYLFQGKIFIPIDSLLKGNLSKEFHNSLEGGHGGIQKTYMRISATFYWQQMRTDVINFIKLCSICQQIKALNVSPYGVLQPLEIQKQI